MHLGILVDERGESNHELSDEHPFFEMLEGHLSWDVGKPCPRGLDKWYQWLGGFRFGFWLWLFCEFWGRDSSRRGCFACIRCGLGTFAFLTLTGEDSLERMHDEDKSRGSGVVCGGRTF